MQEKKIDRRKKYIIVLDTETAGSIASPLFYDFGLAVVDKQGNVYETESFVNYDIFVGQPEKMQTCYFVEKLPQYEEELKSGVRKMSNTFGIRKRIYELLREYDIDTVCAHNMPFDYRAMNNTLAFVTKGRQKFYLPKDINYWDTMQMSRDVICPRKTYEDFCDRHGFRTKTGKVRATAEALYAYISGDPDFVEQHTGLEDVLIEKEILAYCISRKKAMTKEADIKK